MNRSPVPARHHTDPSLHVESGICAGAGLLMGQSGKEDSRRRYTLAPSGASAGYRKRGFDSHLVHTGR